MPILNPRTVSPRLLRLSKQLATSSRICSCAQVRCRHDTAAADSVHGQTDVEHHVNESAPPLRARKHGFKPLPVSPLIRERYANGPPRQNAQQQDSLKDFQKEVAMNPYGKHVPHLHLSGKILIVPPSTSASDFNSPLRSHTRTSPIALPPTFRNNDRDIAGCHKHSTPQTKSPHPARSSCRLHREHTRADELCPEPERYGPPLVAAKALD